MKPENNTIEAHYDRIERAEEDVREARRTLARRLSAIIDEMHHHQGISYAHIAQLCGFSPSYISDLRAGRRLLTRQQAARLEALADGQTTTRKEHIK